ncbi:Taurine catabolism dioxygenase TauD, TfdA family [Novosphingobium sp. CF614]|uniref:TauD/TfdA family dioxygenase n=1 Tax=Novosphingobium sp. CF614 TaxID=1884364 RepID=UPI0008F30141|nr:TauD/TfdA family dioxygenase [Novosphingobium sp. CF614]SFG27504.1 Taurine catabolism dioxygenase TauD, TfdA family [Novosphingobium sp. CF614]
MSTLAPAATHALPPVTTAAAWTGDQLVRSGEWIYHLSEGQVAELEALGTRFVGDDPDLRTVRAGDYPLSACADAVAEWGRDVDYGRGFVLVRGLRTHLYSDVLSAAIYYILGLHMGDPIRQNEMGDLIDHVYATSDKTMDDPSALSSKVRDKLVYHSDSSDIVALMCLRPAMEGGTSCLVSGAAIYNEILRRRPDLAPLLLQPFHWDWRRQDHEAPANTYTSPIVSLVDGVFSMYAGSLYILTAQDYPEVPRLSAGQVEVLNLFDEITYEPGVAIAMDFRPGDIQWLSNYAALHARTTFHDYPEPQRRRHLLRLWLSRDAGRPVVPGFGKNGVVQHRAAPRGGKAEHADGRFDIRSIAIPRLLG